MSGRRLCRLLGSLVVLAAVLGAFGAVTEGAGQLSDVVWTMAVSR